MTVADVAEAPSGLAEQLAPNPKEAALNPPGRTHRNDGLENAQFMMMVGERGPENVGFQAVQA